MSIPATTGARSGCAWSRWTWTDLGQTQDALAGADAVVHFAAIPAPQLRPEGETFRINITSTYNVFAAAVAHKLRRVVWASSETVSAPVRPAARLRADRRMDRATPESSVLAVQAGRRDHGGAVREADRDRVRRPPDSRTSWSPPITRPSRPGRTIRRFASGTCGGTSMRATSRGSAARARGRRSPARRSRSSRPRTRS